MSAIRPHSKRERSLASSVSISFGGLSEEMMICFLLLHGGALKVWKNSSWVALFSYNKLNIVDKKHVDATVFLTEFRRGGVVSVSDRVDQLVCKGLTCDVEHLCFPDSG